MGKGGQKSKTSKQAPIWKTKAAVDCHQPNNKMLRQCPAVRLLGDLVSEAGLVVVK